MKSGIWCLAVCLLLAISCSAQDVQGVWQTSVQENGEALLYVLHVAKTNGAIAATLDVPEHFEFDTAVDSILLDNSILKFRAGQASYEGTLSADSQSIQGTWSVGAETQNAIWRRAASAPASRVDVCEQLSWVTV